MSPEERTAWQRLIEEARVALVGDDLAGADERLCMACDAVDGFAPFDERYPPFALLVEAIRQLAERAGHLADKMRLRKRLRSILATAAGRDWPMLVDQLGSGLVVAVQAGQVGSQSVTDLLSWFLPDVPLMDGLAPVLCHLGRKAGLDAALVERILRQAVRQEREPRTSSTVALATFLLDQNRAAEARPLLEGAIAVARASREAAFAQLGPELRERLSADPHSLLLAEACCATGDAAAAVALIRGFVDEMRRWLARSHRLFEIPHTARQLEKLNQDLREAADLLSANPDAQAARALLHRSRGELTAET